MKSNLSIYCLAALLAFAPIHADRPIDTGNNIGLCSAQVECIDFTVNKHDSTSCDFTGNCAIEVCMILDTTKDACAKEGPISHVCAASDSDGCAAYDNDGLTPLTGKGGSDYCDLTGENSALAFDGKCEPSESQTRIVMCQEAEPGQTVYWALKDADTVDTSVYDYTSRFAEEPEFYYLEGYELEYDGSSCSSPLIQCAGNTGLQCADPSNDMYESTRVWSYKIPENCDLCGNSDPTPSTPSPTSGPTSAPTSGPTGGPTTTTPSSPPLTPTLIESPPVSAPTSDNAPTPGSNGDPHFKTWNDEHFEFHGQCDLILAKDDGFADGLGLDVQIRTKLVRYWSYIKNAAVRIGDDILEVEGSNDNEWEVSNFWVNFEHQGKAATIGGFPLTLFDDRVPGHPKRRLEIDLSSKYPGTKIVISAFKEFVKVDFVNASAEAFGNAVGMLGDFRTGKTLGRDGSTVMDDFNEFGTEWQVLPADNMLFHSTEQPQFPQHCVLPEDPRGQRRRRLEESSVNIEDAERACASLTDELSRKDCVYDIIATQDIDMAGSY